MEMVSKLSDDFYMKIKIDVEMCGHEQQFNKLFPFDKNLPIKFSDDALHSKWSSSDSWDYWVIL